MKKLILTTCLLAGIHAPAWADTIVLAADIWCPINCEPDSVNPGYLIEVAKTVLSEHGHTVKYEVLPWSRAIEETRRGDINGIVGAYREDAPDFVFPEVPLGMMGDVFFVTKDNTWEYKGLESLQGKSLGTIQDYGYTDELNPYVEANLADSSKIQIADGEEPLAVNLRKLLKGRVDVVVESAPVFWYTAGTMGLQDKFKAAGRTAVKSPIFIALSPATGKAAKSAEYAQLLSDGIKKLRASGELARILSKYNLEDWQDQ